MSQEGDNYSSHSADRQEGDQDGSYTNGNGNGNGQHDEDTSYAPEEPETPAAAVTPTVATIAKKKLMGYVGFANLPNQVHRKR